MGRARQAKVELEDRRPRESFDASAGLSHSKIVVSVTPVSVIEAIKILNFLSLPRERMKR